jgi:hypothetical protein
VRISLAARQADGDSDGIFPIACATNVPSTQFGP